MATINISERLILKIVDKYPESKQAFNELFPFTLRKEYKVGDKFQHSLSYTLGAGKQHTIVLIKDDTIGDLCENQILKQMNVENIDRITDYELRLFFGGSYFEMKKIIGNKLINL